VYTAAQLWYDRATARCDAWEPSALLAAKAGTTVSVVIPARNEAATIGNIVADIRRDLVDSIGLVDELIVIDSDSSDATTSIAREHGALTYRAAEIRPDLGWHPGKGEALWKSQFVSTGDLLVFIDADLTGWGTHFVSGLLGPLLTRPDTNLVKGFYDRLLEDGSGEHAPQGGRVTELVARPLINLNWPELSHVVQPLAGEWAIRRETFAGLRVPVGYGVELATLLDVAALDGLDAIAQVDLGARAHSHQSVHDLGVMAAEILLVAARRMGTATGAGRLLWQFDRDAATGWRAREVPFTERGPLTSLESTDAEAG
jgi:glucosyl-3-phosphoglycerate synthase